MRDEKIQTKSRNLCRSAKHNTHVLNKCASATSGQKDPNGNAKHARIRQDVRQVRGWKSCTYTTRCSPSARLEIMRSVHMQTFIENTNTKRFDIKKHIRTPNTFTDAFYELTASVMSNGLGTIRNHRGTTVAYLQNGGGS